MTEHSVGDQSGSVAGKEKADLFAADAFVAVLVCLTMGLNKSLWWRLRFSGIDTDQNRSTGGFPGDFRNRLCIFGQINRSFTVESQIQKRGSRYATVVTAFFTAGYDFGQPSIDFVNGHRESEKFRSGKWRC